VYRVDRSECRRLLTASPLAKVELSANCPQQRSLLASAHASESRFARPDSAPPALSVGQLPRFPHPPRRGCCLPFGGRETEAMPAG